MLYNKIYLNMLLIDRCRQNEVIASLNISLFKNT